MGKQNKYGPYTLTKVRASNVYKQTVAYAGLLGLTKEQYLQALWRDANKASSCLLCVSAINQAFAWRGSYNWDLYYKIAELQSSKALELSSDGLSVQLVKFNIGPVSYQTNQALAERNFWNHHV